MLRPPTLVRPPTNPSSEHRHRQPHWCHCVRYPWHWWRRLEWHDPKRTSNRRPHFHRSLLPRNHFHPWSCCPSSSPQRRLLFRTHRTRAIIVCVRTIQPYGWIPKKRLYYKFAATKRPWAIYTYVQVGLVAPFWLQFPALQDGLLRPVWMQVPAPQKALDPHPVWSQSYVSNLAPPVPQLHRAANGSALLTSANTTTTRLCVLHNFMFVEWKGSWKIERIEYASLNYKPDRLVSAQISCFAALQSKKIKTTAKDKAWKGLEEVFFCSNRLSYKIER